jgi:hypothetical protein
MRCLFYASVYPTLSSLHTGLPFGTLLRSFLTREVFLGRTLISSSFLRNFRTSSVTTLAAISPAERHFVNHAHRAVPYLRYRRVPRAPKRPDSCLTPSRYPKSPRQKPCLQGARSRPRDTDRHRNGCLRLLHCTGTSPPPLCILQFRLSMLVRSKSRVLDCRHTRRGATRNKAGC